MREHKLALILTCRRHGRAQSLNVPPKKSENAGRDFPSFIFS